MSLQSPVTIQAILRTRPLDVTRRTHLRLVTEDDAEFIVGLRTDLELSRYLSQVTGAVADQVDWIRRYKEREAALEEFYFIIVHEMHPVGTVRIYRIERDLPGGGSTFEWGSWIVKPPRPKGVAMYSAQCVYELAFDVLGLTSSHFEVNTKNTGVVRFHEHAGAQFVREDAVNTYFTYSPAQFRKFNAQVASLLAYNMETFPVASPADASA